MHCRLHMPPSASMPCIGIEAATVTAEAESLSFNTLHRVSSVSGQLLLDVVGL